MKALLEASSWMLWWLYAAKSRLSRESRRRLVLTALLLLDGWMDTGDRLVTAVTGTTVRKKEFDQLAELMIEEGKK